MLRCYNKTNGAPRERLAEMGQQCCGPTGTGVRGCGGVCRVRWRRRNRFLVRGSLGARGGRLGGGRGCGGRGGGLRDWGVGCLARRGTGGGGRVEDEVGVGWGEAGDLAAGNGVAVGEERGGRRGEIFSGGLRDAELGAAGVGD